MSSIGGQNRRPSTTGTKQTGSEYEAKGTKSTSWSGQLFINMKNIANTASGPASAMLKTVVLVAEGGVAAAKFVTGTIRGTTKAVFEKFRAVYSGATKSAKTTAGQKPSDTARTQASVDSATKSADDMARTQANVNNIISTLKEKIAGSDIEIDGLFRKTGSIRDAGEIGGSIDKEDIKPEKLEAYSVHVLASVLKKEVKGIELLNGDDLKTMEKPGADKAGIIKDKIAGLPADKKAIIENFMDFIKSNAADARFVERSKMDSRNLAIVIAPNLLSEKVDQSVFLEATQMVAKAVKELIDDNTLTLSSGPGESEA